MLQDGNSASMTVQVAEWKKYMLSQCRGPFVRPWGTLCLIILAVKYTQAIHHQSVMLTNDVLAHVSVLLDGHVWFHDVPPDEALHKGLGAFGSAALDAREHKGNHDLVYHQPAGEHNCFKTQISGACTGSVMYQSV